MTLVRSKCRNRRQWFAWNGRARRWVFIAIAVVLAAINAVVFFGALRTGFSAEVAESAELPYSRREAITLQGVTGSNGWKSDSRSGPAAGKDSGDGQADHEFYPVCLLLSIGDDSNNPDLDGKALPFLLLYRLFDAAKTELARILAQNLLEKQKESGGGQESQRYGGDIKSRMKLLVGVDYPSLACKMARDSLSVEAGLELDCLTPQDVLNRTGHTSPPISWDERTPSSNLACGTVIVGNSARYVPQLPLDWVQLIRWESLRVVDLEKPDSSYLPPEYQLPREQWRPTVVTAFSSNHFAVGVLLLRSLGRSGTEAAQAGLYNISVVVYTLESFNSTLQGILECVVQEISENYKVPTEIREFNYSRQPRYMKINQSLGYEGTGSYAWKGVIMHTVLLERGFVLWADAGDRFDLTGLVETLNYTQKFGFSSKTTSGWVPQWVHPGQIKSLRYHVKYGAAKVTICDGSQFGFTMDKYEAIARPLYECSTTKQCIHPDGASRDNSRFDQAALTLLADMTDNPCTGYSNSVRRHMDNYEPFDYSWTYPTHCYQDPLQVVY